MRPSNKKYGYSEVKSIMKIFFVTNSRFFKAPCSCWLRCNPSLVGKLLLPSLINPLYIYNPNRNVLMKDAWCVLEKEIDDAYISQFIQTTNGTWLIHQIQKDYKYSCTKKTKWERTAHSHEQTHKVEGPRVNYMQICNFFFQLGRSVHWQFKA